MTAHAQLTTFGCLRISFFYLSALIQNKGILPSSSCVLLKLVGKWGGEANKIALIKWHFCPTPAQSWNKLSIILPECEKLTFLSIYSREKQQVFCSLTQKLQTYYSLKKPKTSTDLIQLLYLTASCLYFAEIFSDVIFVADSNRGGQNPGLQKEVDNKYFWYGSWQSRAVGVMTQGCFIYPQNEKQQQPLWLAVPWHKSTPSWHWQHKHFVATAQSRQPIILLMISSHCSPPPPSALERKTFSPVLCPHG